MTTDTVHVFKLPKAEIVLGRMDWIVRRCAGKRVLHLGCVDEGFTTERFRDGTLLHAQLMKVCEEVWGVDVSAAGLQLLKAMGVNNLVYGDIEHLGEINDLKGREFDIILVAEVLEHLNNPGLFLQGVKDLFGANTQMIITVPNCYRLTGFMAKMNGYELVHPDHNYWFSCKTLLNLLEKNGYITDELLTYSYLEYRLMPSAIKSILNRVGSKKQAPFPTKPSDDRTTPRSKRAPLSRIISDYYNDAKGRLIRKILYSRNSFLADGIITVVRPEKAG